MSERGWAPERSVKSIVTIRLGKTDVSAGVSLEVPFFENSKRDVKTRSTFQINEKGASISSTKPAQLSG